MTRQIGFNEVDALEAATHAFWKNGFSGTSLSDLESSMKLTRTSIYNTFGNKQQLFDKVIDYYQKSALIHFIGLLENCQPIQETINKFLNGVIDFHFSKTTPGGCLVVLSLLESEQHQPQTIIALKKIIQMMHKVINKRIKEAQDSEEISSKIDSRTISTTIVTTVTGILVMAKTGYSKAELRGVATTITDLVTCP